MLPEICKTFNKLQKIAKINVRVSINVVKLDAETQADRQTDIQTDKQADRQADKQAN